MAANSGYVKPFAHQSMRMSRRRQLGLDDRIPDPGFDRYGNRRHPDSHYSPDDLEIINDPDSSEEDYDAALTRYRVWEPIPVQPVIIDFANVKEPIFPQYVHPSSKYSMHPDVPLYRRVQAKVRATYSEKALQDAAYWVMMDDGELPAHFNPYKPGSDSHEAFKVRVSLHDDRPRDQDQGLLTLRAVMKRARRKAKRGESLNDQEWEVLVGKPLEEWDIEELAKGYPKQPNGKFSKQVPSAWMQLETKDRIDNLLKEKVRRDMSGLAVNALKVLSSSMEDDRRDDRGKPIVSATTKVDAAKFLIEHLIGKPQQTIKEDISVRLSAILAGVMVSPETTLEQGQGTGRMLVSQRGTRGNYEDEVLKQIENFVDAEVVEDDDE